MFLNKITPKITPKIALFFATMTMRWKFSIVMIGMVLVIGFLGLLTIEMTVSKALYREIEERGLLLSRDVAADSAEPLLHDNRIKLRLLLYGIAEREKEVRYIYIRDGEGEVVAHTFAQGVPRGLAEQPPPSPDDPAFRSRLYDTEDGVIKEIAMPILGSEVGMVHVGLSLASVEQAMARIHRLMLAILLLLLLIGIGGAFFLSALISGPLETLAAHAGEIGRGNLDLTIPVRGQDEIGNLAATINTMVTALRQDLDRRRRAEQALAAEKERLAVTLRSIGDGVITTDTRGRVVLLNKVAEQLTGWRQEEAAGLPLTTVFNIINEKSREKCENPVTKVLESGQIIGLANHTALIARDGTERAIADSGAPIRDADSEVIGVVLVFRDVTEQKHLEREMLKIRKLESVGVLAGGIAHDFNNILAAILGNLELVLLDTGAEDARQPLLVEARQASLRARGLTGQLLTFAKGGNPVKTLASIDEVVRESCTFALRGSNVRCAFAIAEDLWPVEIDAGQIGQVIHNLVINADQAMPSGGVIEVSCENEVLGHDHILPLAAGPYVKIAVRDRGEGIPPHLLELIFDPYFTTKQEGSGLGLAITHSIVSKHGGYIAVESVRERGTTFTVYLQAIREGQPGRQEAEPVVAGPRQPLRVLVMDDEAVVRQVASHMLAHLGHETLLAATGEEAIETYRTALRSEAPVQVTILDLTIAGGMGGRETVQHILELHPEARVIVSSGYSNDPVMADYAQFGFRAAMVKPYRINELAAALDQALL